MLQLKVMLKVGLTTNAVFPMLTEIVFRFRHKMVADIYSYKYKFIKFIKYSFTNILVVILYRFKVV
jgi:hypothetical protein